MIPPFSNRTGYIQQDFDTGIPVAMLKFCYLKKTDLHLLVLIFSVTHVSSFLTLSKNHFEVRKEILPFVTILKHTKCVAYRKFIHQMIGSI